jgi:ribosome biogenesis GTPase
MNTLSSFGWSKELDESWQARHAPGTQPGRVVADFGTSLKVATPDVITAELSGKLAHYSRDLDVPKVGDWVALRLSDNSNAVIEAVLPRRGEIARKVAGNQTKKQVIATHIDIAFVLLALDNDFSVDRLRRFLYQLSINSIQPVIVLNKADKTDDVESYARQLASFELPIIKTIATEGVGVDELLAYIRPGHTAILLGSSGVGKSTLTNHLLGRLAQKTQTVRESDDTGKHTTVHRELFMLPGGGLLIDTPGIRELQLWGTEEDLEENYDDIAALASKCRYSSCQHGTEEGCAIQQALKDGSLSRSRYDAYLKMKNELVTLKVRNTARLKRSNVKSKRSANRQNRDELKEIREDMS